MNQRLCFLAVRTDSDTTPHATGMYSNQLNYETITFIPQSLLSCDAKGIYYFESCNSFTAKEHVG